MNVIFHGNCPGVGTFTFTAEDAKTKPGNNPYLMPCPYGCEVLHEVPWTVEDVGAVSPSSGTRET